MALMAETQVANNNLASRDELKRKMGLIESQVFAWAAECSTLHSAVEEGDKAEVLEMHSQLSSKLQAALTI